VAGVAGIAVAHTPTVKEQPTGAHQGTKTNRRCIMKALTIHTLVLTVALLGTSSMAAAGELSTVTVSPTEQRDTHSATKATSSSPLFALSSLDTQSLAAQEMTDQELQAVEGGTYIAVPQAPSGYETFYVGFYKGWYTSQCSCR
jgi:bacteriocin-like protein